MKLDPAVTLVTMLFALMAGAASVSAFWGYSLGRQALSGVTQPDIRNTNRSGVDGADLSVGTVKRNEALRSEEEILAQVTAHMQGKAATEAWPDFQAEASASNQNAEEAPDANVPDESLAAETEADVSLVNYEQSLPLLTESRQVILAVNSVRRQGNVVRVGVSLQNMGDRPVEFLYSLMDVLDEQGQSLSVSTDGLPQEIPPTGETFEGAVTIPGVLLGTSDTLSLRLTDYPSQAVELQINDIPVTR